MISAQGPTSSTGGRKTSMVFGERGAQPKSSRRMDVGSAFMGCCRDDFARAGCGNQQMSEKATGALARKGIGFDATARSDRAPNAMGKTGGSWPAWPELVARCFHCGELDLQTSCQLPRGLENPLFHQAFPGLRRLSVEWNYLQKFQSCRSPCRQLQGCS